tara:strand:+ start:153 stop:302 length:150 start_codon:yes stop_codon:yes gene_type:complete
MSHTHSNGKKVYSVDMMIAYVNIFKPKSKSIEVNTLLHELDDYLLLLKQ